jgi:hypothetical protein
MQVLRLGPLPNVTDFKVSSDTYGLIGHRGFPQSRPRLRKARIAPGNPPVVSPQGALLPPREGRWGRRVADGSERIAHLRLGEVLALARLRARTSGPRRIRGRRGAAAAGKCDLPPKGQLAEHRTRRFSGQYRVRRFQLSSPS